MLALTTSNQPEQHQGTRCFGPAWLWSFQPSILHAIVGAVMVREEGGGGGRGHAGGLLLLLLLLLAVARRQGQGGSKEGSAVG